MDKLILKWALKNAVDHEGKAQLGAVIPKVIGERPELKKDVKEIAKLGSKIVSDVNKLSLDEQMSRLKKIDPKLLEKREIKERELAPLPGDTSNVVVRIPPGPEKYSHIGHAITFMINYMYAEKYKGKVWLRFEDTNPEKCKKEFYDVIKQGLQWLGIKWDFEKNESDSLKMYYSRAKSLIESGNAYVCTCDVEKVRENRRSGTPCDCRINSVEDNLKLWKRMFDEFKQGEAGFRQGEAILRLKGDMESKDTSFRDPMLLRINDTPHCLTGNKYRVWPGYDFTNAIEDSECGITHVLRSNEFNTKLQKHLRKLMGYENDPEYVEYGRYNIIGGVTKGRVIRELVENGTVSGWDDPRLVTIKAIEKRGIVPETIRELGIDVGTTSQPTNITWEKVCGINRKHLDPVANRYFFVPDPVKIKVEDAPKKTAEVPIHPDFPERGKRKLPTAGEFYISKFDLKDEFRLKDLYNVKITKREKMIVGKYTGDEIKDIPKVQWVTDDHVKIKVIKPNDLFINEKLNPRSLEIIEGFAEPVVRRIKKGEVVQFERFGFCRFDGKDFIFAHK
jgi:glutamyl-tRNA synthetase